MPPKKQLPQIMKAASFAARSIQEVEDLKDKLSLKQKSRFESLMAGYDALQVALRSGDEDWFTGITKMVDTVDGGRLLTSKVTLANVGTLTPKSYQRLVSICDSKVREYMGAEDYRQYVLPIREYIQRFAPLALGTVMDVMANAPKPETRLKAATDLLDRAGEKAAPSEKDIVVPVQVNIMLTGQDGTVTQYGE